MQFFYLRVPASAKDVLIKHWQKLAKIGYACVTTLPKDKDLFVGRSASTVESQQATCANTARPFTSAPRYQRNQDGGKTTLVLFI